MKTRKAEELMRRYAATMRDEKEDDLARLRTAQRVSPTERKAPKKKMSLGAKYAVIAACSCVLVLAILLPVVFTGSFLAAGQAPDETFESEDSFPMDGKEQNKSPTLPSEKVFAVITEDFRLTAPDGNTVTYDLLPEEERPESAEDSAENSVEIQTDGISYPDVKWIVFSGSNGIKACVYVACTQEKKNLYEKTYDQAVSFGSYRLQYKITSGQDDEFFAQGKIESGNETIFIEYSQIGGNLDAFCSWLNAVVSVK